MKFAIKGDDFLVNIFKTTLPNVNWEHAATNELFIGADYVDAYFDLDPNSEIDYSFTSKPVFINSVTHTLLQNNSPQNVLRLNCWPGIIEKDLWELAGNLTTQTQSILEKIGKRYIVVPDEPGFVSARIIAMIINEAYFALGDNVSSRSDIDVAMKLGTGYPYGPFEWCEKIGAKNVVQLLKTLSTFSSKYSPAPALLNELNLSDGTNN